MKQLRLLREAGTIKVVTGTSPKLADRGVQCMMVGYAENHNVDVFYMWNLVTEWVYLTRNII